MHKRIWVLLIGLVFLAGACSSPAEKKQAFYEKGKAYFEQKDFVKARLELKNALQIDPEFAPAYYMLGKTSLGLKNPKAAFQNFATAVKLDPDHIEARLDMGRMFVGAKMYDQALAQVAEVLGRDAENTDAQFLQIMVYLKQKDVVQAKLILDSLGGPEGKGEQYFLLLASYQKLMGQEQDSVKTLEQGLEANPESMPLIMTMVKYYGSVKDVDRMEEYLNKAVALAPDADGIKLNLAWLYLVEKKSDKAMALINEMIAGDTENDKIRIACAVLLMKGGLKDEGVKMIKEGMELHPHVYNYYAVLSELSLKEKKVKDAEELLGKFVAFGDKAARNDLIKAKLSLSKLKLLQKNVGEAEALIDEVLADDAGNADAHFLKGRIYLAKGDGPGAVTKFRAVINDYPDNIEGYLGLAGAHALNQDFDLSLDVLQTALKKQPDSTKILQAMTRINLARKDTVAAEANLKEIVSLDPDNLVAIAGLGDIYMATDQYDEAMAQYDKLKTQEKGEVLGVFKKADALARQGKIGEAIAEMEAGYEENSTNPVFINALAKLYFKTKKYDEAIEKFKETTAIDPDNLDAIVGVGDIYLVKEQYDDAMVQYQKLKSIEKAQALGMIKISGLLVRQGKLEQAVKEMEAGYERNKKTSVYVSTLAQLYAKSKRYDEAAAKYKEAVEANPKNRLGWYGLASSHEMLKDYAGAMAVYEQILKDQPNSWMAANNLASYLAELNPTDETLDRAVTLARKADKLNPDSALVEDTLGWALFKKGEVKEAEKYITKAYEKMPGHVAIACHMGVLSHKLGHKEAAAKALATVVANDAEFLGRDEAIKIYQENYAN